MFDRVIKGHGSLIAATLSINLLALALPLMSRQIVKLGQQDGSDFTILSLVLIVVVASIGENLFRLGRSLVIAGSEKQYRSRALYWLMRQAVRHRPPRDSSSPAARSIDFQRAIEQLRGQTTGEDLVAYFEILFVPIILSLIFLIDVRIGLVVTVVMLVFAGQAWFAIRSFHDCAARQREHVEQRFDILFAILRRLPNIKGLAIEPHMARLYEYHHANSTRSSLALAKSATRISQSGTEMGPAISAILLIAFAVFAASEQIALATVIATVILAQRIVDPVQRAIFIVMQRRDRSSANERLSALSKVEETIKDADGFDLTKGCRLAITALQPDPDERGNVPSLSLDIAPGEMIAFSSADPRWASMVLRCIAGVDPSEAGAISVNNVAIEFLSTRQRAAAFGYVSAQVGLFDGTIADNITRFGAVSVSEAFHVAALLGIQGRLDELPRGLDTEVTGTGGSIAPGLARQIAILRALSHRPRVILLDHAEQGLDREGYADLAAFCEKVRGSATVLIASNDANFTSLAEKHLVLTGGEWRENTDTAFKIAESYRSLNL